MGVNSEFYSVLNDGGSEILSPLESGIFVSLRKKRNSE